jgi:hypothetical protein
MMNSGLAQKLEAVVAGVLSLESVLADPAHFEGAAKASFYGLQHFLADADIRAKDSAYREMQYGEMQKLIHFLKSGAGAEALAKITFLRVSNE